MDQNILPWRICHIHRLSHKQHCKVHACTSQKQVFPCPPCKMAPNRMWFFLNLLCKTHCVCKHVREASLYIYLPLVSGNIEVHFVPGSELGTVENVIYREWQEEELSTLFVADTPLSILAARVSCLLNTHTHTHIYISHGIMNIKQLINSQVKTATLQRVSTAWWFIA